MAAASNWLEEAVLNYFFRGQPVAQPQNLFLALYINDPTDADTGTEISRDGTGYEPQIIVFTEPRQEGNRAVITNKGKISFPRSTGSWGNPITYWGVRTAQEGGNLLAYGNFTINKTIDIGELFSIETGSLKINVA